MSRTGTVLGADVLVNRWAKPYRGRQNISASHKEVSWPDFVKFVKVHSVEFKCHALSGFIVKALDVHHRQVNMMLLFSTTVVMWQKLVSGLALHVANVSLGFSRIWNVVTSYSSS